MATVLASANGTPKWEAGLGGFKNLYCLTLSFANPDF